MGTTFVIESTMDKGWSNLWFETDSILVTKAFMNHNIVSWDIINRWRRCLDKIRHMHFKITQIFREENKYTDKLANLDIDSRIEFF